MPQAGVTTKSDVEITVDGAGAMQAAQAYVIL